MMIEPGQAPLETTENAAEQLAALIEPWLQHMQWRADFAEWRQKRLHSEDYQSGALAQVTSVAGLLEGRHLLDIGCGMGGFAVAACRNGALVTALDYNQSYCAITTVRALQYDLALPVVRAAGEALPLPDSAYDLVTAWDVLEHVQNPAQMLAEIARVLQPGGIAFVTVINRLAFRDPHYHLPLINYLPRFLGEAAITLFGRSKRGSALRDRQRLGEMHYYTFDRFSRLAADHGFVTVDLDEERVRQGDIAPRRARLRSMLQLVDRLGLTVALYRLYRGLYQGTYRLVLHKVPRDV
jgi:2-polyprenyl-3-methyl-5-hydroxy-6-metoxy-1,4-benzoquinol methylase